MLEVAAAADLIIGRLVPLAGEQVALREASGRVLADDVVSDVALPPWDNSAMDGYAVRTADIAGATEAAPVSLRVVATIAAGQRADRSLGAGDAMRIMTGAPVPAGADAVIRVEDTDGGTARVSIRSSRDAGRNVRPRGEDTAPGALVAPRGAMITPAMLALLAAVGCARPSVARRPVVAVLGSGDELATLDRFDEVRAGRRIVATNGYVLGAIIREAGGEVLDLGVVPDDRAALAALVRDAATRADLVVTTAGVSVGEHDHIRAIVAELGRVVFWRINARPGSQLAFGEIGGTPWLGLPGNPASAAITGELFVRPAVLRLQGVTAVHRALIRVRLGAAIRGAESATRFVRARLAPYAGGFLAHLSGAQGSGLMSAMAHADALLVIPGGADDLPAGTTVAAIPLRGAVAMDLALRIGAASEE